MGRPAIEYLNTPFTRSLRYYLQSDDPRTPDFGFPTALFYHLGQLDWLKGQQLLDRITMVHTAPKAPVRRTITAVTVNLMDVPWDNSVWLPFDLVVTTAETVLSVVGDQYDEMTSTSVQAVLTSLIYNHHDTGKPQSYTVRPEDWGLDPKWMKGAEKNA